MDFFFFSVRSDLTEFKYCVDVTYMNMIRPNFLFVALGYIENILHSGDSQLPLFCCLLSHTCFGDLHWMFRLTVVMETKPKVLFILQVLTHMHSNYVCSVNAVDMIINWKLQVTLSHTVRKINVMFLTSAEMWMWMFFWMLCKGDLWNTTWR